MCQRKGRDKLRAGNSTVVMMRGPHKGTVIMCSYSNQRGGAEVVWSTTRQRERDREAVGVGDDLQFAMESPGDVIVRADITVRSRSTGTL